MHASLTSTSRSLRRRRRAGLKLVARVTVIAAALGLAGMGGSWAAKSGSPEAAPAHARQATAQRIEASLVGVLLGG